MENTKTKQEEEAAKYPGVAIDIADGEKVNDCMVKEDTKRLDNNHPNDGVGA